MRGAVRRVARAARFIRELALMTVGMPSYEAYLVHMSDRHPGATVMSRAAFFRNRQDARYGKGGGSKCC